MTRREEIENIIIGTLLCSDYSVNYYESCRCCITPDMFSDDTNRRIYEIVVEMNANGIIEVSPYTIYTTYGDKVRDMICRMCELATDYSFLHMKTQYNEMMFVRWHLLGIRPRYTDVKFDDYVNRFIQLVFENDERGKDNR